MKAWPSPLALFSAVVLASLLGTCSLWVPASPMAARIPRIGLMHVGTDHIPPSLGTLVERLTELGWMDGTKDEILGALTTEGRFTGPRIELLWHNLEPGEEQDQAADYVAQAVDVIVAFEDKSIAAAKAATAGAERPIPVVFLHPSDPVRDELVASLAEPGGNLTGVFGARDPVAKQLELYDQIIPGLQRLLTLVDPTDNLATPPLLAEARAAAEQLGIELVEREASNQAELEEAFRALGPGEVDGAFLLSPSLRLNFSQLSIDLAAEAEIPVQAHRKEWAAKGALFSLGVDIGPVGREGAFFVDSILKGTAPADLPVRDVQGSQFAINLDTARKLEIDVPPEVIDLADEVYP
jgi:putative tryptophan/tyrosine transport system substrate-binding protein